MNRYEYFKLFYDINISDFNLLTEKLKTKTFKKGESIIVCGQVQRELYFVKSGVQMSYFDDGDKIYTLGFTTYPHLCGVAESFSFQRPSKYYVDCLSDSVLEYITYDELQELLDQSQQIERLFRRMTEAMFSLMIDIHIELRAMTIEERFKKFCKNNPDLVQVVPHKYIASYLGINPTNFSKLFNKVKF